MPNRLVLFSSAIAEGADPLHKTLTTPVSVTAGIKEVAVSDISVLPRTTPKALIQLFVKNFNQGGAKLDFDGTVVVSDRKMDANTTEALDRLTKVGLAVVGPYDAIDDTSLDVTDGAISFDADSDELTNWLATGDAPVPETPEEAINNQLSDLFGDMDLDTADDGDTAVGASFVPSDEQGASEEPQEEQAARHSADSVSDTRITVADAAARHSEELASRDDSNDEAESERLKDGSSTDADETVSLRWSDDGTASVDSGEVTTGEPVTPKKHRPQSRREAYDGVKRQSAPAQPKKQWSLAEPEGADDLSDDDLDSIAESEQHADRDGEPDGEYLSDAELDRALDEETSRTFTDSDDAFTGEMEPIRLSQEELLDRDDSDEESSGEVADAYIDTTADPDSDYGTNGARAGEPIMVNPQEEAQEEPEILRKRRERNERSRQAVESMIPDPSTFDSESPDLDELRSNDGGSPKDEAPSETPGTSMRTTNGSSEGERRDDERSSLHSVVKAGRATAGSDIRRAPSRRERVGFHAQEVRVSDGFDTMKGKRNRHTRAMAVTGPSGGSGKTTSTYGLALASAAVDKNYAEQRDDQWTWVIEMDYRNPKYYNRTSMQGDQYMLSVVKEHQRRNGEMTQAELIECAKKFSYPLYGDDVYPKARLLMAPPTTAYGDGVEDITADEMLAVTEKLINALSVNRDEPSTIFLDMPDYAGESLDRTAAIANRFCDCVAVVFPDEGDFHDIMKTIESLRTQKRARVDSQRIAVIGTKLRKGQAANMERKISDMQVHFAGYIPDFPELRSHVNDYDLDSGDDPTERKNWILNAEKDTQQVLIRRCIRILSETRINRMAEEFLRDAEARSRQRNAGRGGSRNPQKRSGGSVGAKKSASKGRSGSSKKKQSKKKSGGIGSIFGISKK